MTIFFKDSAIKLDVVTLPGLDIPHPDVYTYIYCRATPGYDYMPSMVYVPWPDGFVVFALRLDSEREWCVLKIGQQYFAGSTDENYDAAALLADCEKILN